MRTSILTIFISCFLGINSISSQVPVTDWSYVINNLNVDFTDMTTNNPTFWLWDFGDGNTSNQQNPSHTYQQYGTYTTCLTTSNVIGADSTCQFVRLMPPPPAFSKSFNPAIIPQGGTTTLTFSIDNSGSAVAAFSLDFTDNLPVGMVVASPPNDVSSCSGGTLTAVTGSSVISYTGGSVGAGATCTISIDVKGNDMGILVNTSGDLTSDAGNSGNASATLEVTAPIPTLGEWGIIILFLSFVIIGSVYLLSRRDRKSYLS